MEYKFFMHALIFKELISIQDTHTHKTNTSLSQTQTRIRVSRRRTSTWYSKCTMMTRKACCKIKVCVRFPFIFIYQKVICCTKVSLGPGFSCRCTTRHPNECERRRFYSVSDVLWYIQRKWKKREKWF